MRTSPPLIVLVFLLTACAGGPPPFDPDGWVELDADRAGGFQTALENARAEQGLAGMAMAVAWRDTQELWVGTSGMSDIEASQAWTPEQTFRIGSTTKPFTTAAVFQLVEGGVIGLDDPIEQWVPGFWTGPTIRDLLGHSSGIVSYNYVGDFDDAQQYTPDALVQWAWDHDATLQFEPGSRWEYSNTNYVLLGLVIEAATGTSYEVQLQDRFLDPLGLDDTRLAGAGDVDARLVRSYEGDPPADITGSADPSMGWAAGGMVSTPADLARWQVALNSGAVLSDESYARMSTPGGLTGEGESEYGLGAFVEAEDGLVIVGHTGGIAGYQTFAYYLQDPGVALVLMSNTLPTDLRAASQHGWAEILGLEL